MKNVYIRLVAGKGGRPIKYVRESFWRGHAFSSLERANQDLLAWAAHSTQRVHGTTQEKVCDRFAREKAYLGSLPVAPPDTSYALYRSVHKDCTFCFEANRYVAPHGLVGRTGLLRVKNDSIRLFDDDRLVATYAQVSGKGQLCDPHGFYQRLQMNRRKFGDIRHGKGRARQMISPSMPSYASTLTVESRELAAYSLIGGEVAHG